MVDHYHFNSSQWIAIYNTHIYQKYMDVDSWNLKTVLMLVGGHDTILHLV